jgi:hypothetical protein
MHATLGCRSARSCVGPKHGRHRTCHLPSIRRGGLLEPLVKEAIA